MQRFFIYLSYDGAAYHGWQVQPNGLSVQECLERALATLLRRPTAVTGAGRTDAGVHAARMVAHFDAEGPVDPVALADKLNRLLPPDIAVQRVRPVRPDAHARFDATARTYHYFVTTAKSPFLRGYRCRLYREPDFAAMNRAAALLLEYSDFTSFSKLHTDVRTNDCRVSLARWEQVDEVTWRFTIRADRFLRNMVRAIVGTLLDVGRGRLSLEGFRAVVEARDRCRAGSSAPAEGLFLAEVEYPEAIFLNEE